MAGRIFKRDVLAASGGLVINCRMGAFGAGRFCLAQRPAGSASLLVVVGGDRGRLAAKDGRSGYAGGTDFHRLLGDEIAFDELHVGSKLRSLSGIPDLSPYHCILNLVTDPDQNPQTLGNLRKLLRGFGGKVVNRPEAVLRSNREQIAALLSGIPGLRVPKVVRLRGARPDLAARSIQRDGLTFPLILRRAGTHTGNIVGLTHDLDDLQSALSDARDHVVTEFADTRSADGLYRKYRIFFFGKRVLLRHMIVHDQWSVHGSTRMRFMVHQPALLREEALLCARAEGPFPPIWNDVFREVRARIPLEFFGMDFGVDRDSKIVLFEANATMNFFPPVTDPRFGYLKLPVPAGRRAFHELLLS